MNLDPSGWRCLENCLVKLPTLSDMEVRTAPFSPDKYFTKRLPVIWDPTQDGAEVLEFLGQVSDSDAMKQGLIEVLAWRLEPGYPHQWILFHVGQGANGKSVYLKLLRRTLGPGYASAVPLQNLADQKDKFHKTRLYGKCSNSCEDIGHSAIKDAGELKNLSAGGRVQAEYKFGDIFEFDNEAKLEFSTNHPPLIEDDSYGIDRRVRSYPWKKEFKGEDADPNKFFKLNTPENISGLFNLALAAYKGLVERGELSGVRIGSEAITMEANAPRFFLDEECSFDEKNEDGLDRGGLFKNYLLWCKEKGVETPGTIKGFSKAIEKWFKDNHRLLLVEKSGSVNTEGKRPFMVRFMACDYVPGIDIKNAATIAPPSPEEEDALEDREDILEAIDTLKKAGQDGFTKSHLVELFDDPRRGEKVFERFLTNGEIGSSSRHNGRFIWLGRPGRR